jgi:hypothetical protein
VLFPPVPELPPDLYRVEIADFQNAITSSSYGSVVESIPENVSWRYESMAVVDKATGVGTVQPYATFDALNVHPWHAEGYKGQGMKIAVFDVEWFGADWPQEELADVSTHDCFAHKSCDIPIDTSHIRFGFERGVHGFACAEVIRDIAPEAELYLVRVNGLTSLENAIHWAITKDIDVISMSLSFFNESFYDGSGPVSNLMNQLVANDIVMITSAGNYAQQHYRNDFDDRDADGFHDFSYPNGLPVYFPKGNRRINLIWDEYQHCGHSDLDLYVWNQENILVGRGIRDQTLDKDNCHPTERITIEVPEDGWYSIQVHYAKGNGIPTFDIMARGGYVYDGSTENSIVDPGNHPNVMTVGAVRVDDYLHSSLEGFSSQGYSDNGFTKPDVVGPNGLTTQSYGPKGFFGTSASTPAVAGALAILLSRHTELTNIEGMRYLRQASVQDSLLEPPSVDLGYGRVRLPTISTETGCSGMGVFLIPIALLTRRRKKIYHEV